jgi:hypothetical protein
MAGYFDDQFLRHEKLIPVKVGTERISTVMLICLNPVIAAGSLNPFGPALDQAFYEEGISDG